MEDERLSLKVIKSNNVSVNVLNVQSDIVDTFEVTKQALVVYLGRLTHLRISSLVHTSG